MAKNWWQSFFDDNFGVFLDRQNDPDLLASVSFLSHKLNLPQGGCVFDQCCGTGALSLEFARAGFSVTGIDQAESYIARAKSKAHQGNLDILTHFNVADAFTFAANPLCDAAVNWYSSFGYSQDDRVNIQMFQRLHDSVKSGGKVAVEYMHIPQILANFKPLFTRDIHIDGHPVHLEKRTVIDKTRGMISSEWTYKFSHGQDYTRQGESRLYMPSDISDMLQSCGFENIELVGGLHGESLTTQSPRVIAVGRKP